jgi:hypothetical protein
MFLQEFAGRFPVQSPRGVAKRTTGQDLADTKSRLAEPVFRAFFDR